MRTRLFVVAGGALMLSAQAMAGCKKPVELAGSYSGAGTEAVTLSGGIDAKSFRRAPLDERVTVTRGAARELHIKYGSCDLPARQNPDALSATIVYGKCWVSGFPGPIPVEGTFAVDPAGRTMTVLVTGAMLAAAGNVAYSYGFTGTRVAP